MQNSGSLNGTSPGLGQETIVGAFPGYDIVCMFFFIIIK